SAPAACAMDAAQWRRSCSRIGGSPALNAAHSKMSVTRSGCSGPPGSAGKTCPGAVPAAPGGPVGQVGLAPFLEHGDGVLVQGDRRVGVIGLDRRLDGLPTKLDDGRADRQLAGVEVE